MTVQEFLAILFEVRVNGHIAHLQTTSFAEHKALNELYDEIVDLQDTFVESYQGKYGIIKDYQQIKVFETTNILPWLKLKVKAISAYRETLTDGYLQNITDSICELIYSTIYKLENLS